MDVTHFQMTDEADNIVLTIDESPNHVIRILDWRQNKVLAKTTVRQRRNINYFSSC